MYRRTIFNTPLITPLCRGLGRLWLGLTGWRIEGAPPPHERCVIIAYPHTSNWDVPYTIAISLNFNLQIHWMCKASLLRGPMGPVMLWLGAIPVRFDRSQNLVEQMVSAFRQAPELILVIAPEANRQRVHSWKTGFYHIALGADIPIVLGYLDFSRKLGGYLGSFTPSGDLDRDMPLIQEKYRGIQGRYPEQSELYSKVSK